MLNAEIIAVGTEMLTPHRIDTNSLWLTEQLNAFGIEVRMKVIVGDDEARLEEAIRDALRRSHVVIATGGLGPTEDDITRKIFSRVLGRRLQLHQPTLDHIRARFAKRNMKMPEINARQALVPERADILDNERGTAPGLMMREKNALIFLLPGSASRNEADVRDIGRSSPEKRSGFELYTAMQAFHFWFVRIRR